jgi:predicted nucleic acid-binding protein
MTPEPGPSCVIDCSVTMAWCFSDEASPATDGLLDALVTGAAVVPALWQLEVANVLALAERRGRITPAAVSEFLGMLRGLDLRVDEGDAWKGFDPILGLCRAYGVTSYDAAYLDVCLRRALPLATLDKALVTACRKLGIGLVLPSPQVAPAPPAAG